MGMEQVVTLTGSGPSWTEISALLGRKGFPIQVRMIDGELSFPDETPPEAWRELRVSTPQGMVTLRRDPGRMVVVTWGNAERGLSQAWNALVWAIAKTGGGMVQTSDGPRVAGAYAKGADLPAGIQVED